MATWLDRSIGWVSPGWGARRAASRLQMEALSYDGGRKDRRTSGWRTTSTDQDTASRMDRETIRNNARDLVRNNPNASKVLDVKVVETIGAGITPEFKRASKELKNRWERFVDECDASGQSDLYGLQALIERCRFESGEVLVRRVYQPVSAEKVRLGSIPLRLQVLEPDYLDASRSMSIEGGGQIRDGIEYDASGRVVAYYLFREHPGSSAPGLMGRMGLATDRVPAEDVLHIFRKLRPGQTRGVSEFAPVIIPMRDLGDYDDAERVRKKVMATLAAFVRLPGGPSSSPLLGPGSTDDKGRLETLYPGLIAYLKPGEDITFTDPKSDSGYADYKRFSLRDICAGAGVPYELATGDLSQVNYSSARVGLVHFRRRVEQDQYHVHIPGHCDPIVEWFLEDLQAREGDRYGARATVDWTPPRYELLDPVKENQADIAAIQGGLELWEEVVRRRGWNAEQQLQAIADWQQKLRDMGVIVTSDASVNAGPSAQRFADPATSSGGDDGGTDEEEAA